MRKNGDYDINAVSWNRHDPDILRAAFSSRAFPYAGQNFARVADPAVDRMLDVAAHASEPERTAAYGELQRYVMDHAFVLPTYVPHAAIAVSQ